MAPQAINWAIYNSLPSKEAKYQLGNIHDSKRQSVAIAYIICYLISVPAVAMRFVSRRIGRIPYQADDWAIVVADLLAVMNSVPTISAAFNYGGAQHVILMTEKDPVRFSKSVFASEILYPPSIAMVKISTLLLYARIFPGPTFKRMLKAVCLFISTYSAIWIVTSIFQCRPVSRVWDPTVNAKCIEIDKVFIVMGSLNVLTDALLLCLPLPQLWRLQMRRRTKLQLTGIFSIGSLVTVISIYRIPQLRGLSLYSYDPTWTDVEPLLWSLVEVSVAILGACAITFRPLLNWIFRNWISKIKMPLSRPGGRSSSRESSNHNAEAEVRPNHRSVIKMHPLSVSLPSFPSPTYDAIWKGNVTHHVEESTDL